MDNRCDQINNATDMDEETESTEKIITADFEGKFEMILDIIKTNTNLTIGD